MNVLLDTHVLIWWLEDPTELNKKAIKIIENLDNSIFVSTAAIWEITIKESIGKLKLEGDIFKTLEESQFIPLSITVDHVKELKKLPSHHHDPFDRIMIAQSRVENFIFMSRDEKITKYELNLTIP